jgi:hypothetical protein
MRAAARLSVGPLTETDLAGALALNNTAEPHVPATTEDGLRRLLGFARIALSARRDGELLGLLIGLAPGTGHDSPYYAWFCARYRDFLYVDRIVVAQAARGLGVGRALYAAAEALPPLAPRVCCEVNELPPNPASLAFHTAIGFRAVGRVETNRQKRVIMLEKPLG